MKEKSENFRLAEESLAEKGNPRQRKRAAKHKIILLSVLSVCLALLAVDYFLNESSSAEPSYTALPVDSSSIAESARMLEDYAVENGTLPRGFLEYSESSEGLVNLTINGDSSFTYSEGSISFRSAHGILTGEAP